MALTASNRIKHHSITQAGGFTIPVTEDIKQWIASDLGDREIGLDKFNNEVWMRNDSTLIKLYPGSSTEYSGNFISQTITPVWDSSTNLITIDASTLAYNLMRFDTIVTCEDLTNNKYYTWTHIMVIKNMGGTFTKMAEHYSDVNLNGFGINCNVIVDISNPIINIGLECTTPITANTFAVTTISGI